MSSQFPKLTVIARCILGIPATQNISERDFSSAGQTISERRSRLDSDNVNYLLVIRDASLKPPKNNLKRKETSIGI